jgi:HEPN domain-containing protein
MSELPDTSAAEARRWLMQVDEDLLAARHIAVDPDLPPRIACFWSHLAAEKALKAYLIAHEVPYPKTHDLADLRALIPSDAELVLADADLQRLNPWTIEGRYPGDVPEATDAQAEDCLGAAERVVRAVHLAVDDRTPQ